MEGLASCQNINKCRELEKFLRGTKGPNNLDDILAMLAQISADDSLRSGALSCRAVFGTKCMLHPNNPKITDGRITNALKKL